MIETVKTAAVFGAGSMGGGIAARFANAGVPVLLFDRPGFVEAGVARQLKAGAFIHPGRAKLVSPRDVGTDVDRVADADWIVEAVVEDLSVKRDLFASIDDVRKPGSIVSSNTSTISLARLVHDMKPAFAESFVITHFFNPPRAMPLACELMFAADIVIAASDCRFAQLEVKRGIMANHGAIQRMVARAGWGDAMLYLLTGDEFGPEAAYRMRLVQEVVKPGAELDRASAIAERIAVQAPLAVAATLANARTMILEGHPTAAAELGPVQAQLLETEDAVEGLLSFRERRLAAFEGR